MQGMNHPKRGTATILSAVLVTILTVTPVLADGLGDDLPLPIRKSVPDAAKLEAAEKEIKRTFETEYAAKDPAMKAALAAKLLQLAKDTTDDLAVKYVLLREARDLSAAMGIPEVALNALREELSRSDHAALIALRGQVTDR